MRKFIVWILIGCALLIILNVIGMLLVKGSPEYSLRRTMYGNFFQYSVQFVFIALAGAIVVKEYDRRRNGLAELNDFRQEMYKSIVNVYLKTKCVRWTLRSNHHHNKINHDTYTKQMQQIIELKSDIEVLRHEINHYSSHIKKIRVNLDHELDAMECYLRDLLSDFNSGTEPEDNKISTENLDFLKAFVDNAKQNPGQKSDFTLKYREPFQRALALFATNRTQQIEEMNKVLEGF